MTDPVPQRQRKSATTENALAATDEVPPTVRGPVRETASWRSALTLKTDLDLIDVPIVLFAGLGLALFLLWFGRQTLQTGDLQLPLWLQTPAAWLATAPVTAVGWFVQKAVRRQRKRPIGQSYLMWIFLIAIGTILLVLGIRIPLQSRPAEDGELVSGATTELRLLGPTGRPTRI
ncbi:MAG: hypothetical protein K2R93_21455 [Gemmatimonadaceae bacterium]|nr:hypothetical protein [Gemmatimonadaceae bacterium]